MPNRSSDNIFFRTKTLITKFINTLINWFYELSLSLVYLLLLITNLSFLLMMLLFSLQTLFLLPLIPLMILEPVTALIALGITIRTQGHLFIFSELLEKDLSVQLDITSTETFTVTLILEDESGNLIQSETIPINGSFQCDLNNIVNYQENSSWQSIQDAWDKNNYTFNTISVFNNQDEFNRFTALMQRNDNLLRFCNSILTKNHPHSYCHIARRRVDDYHDLQNSAKHYLDKDKRRPLSH